MIDDDLLLAFFAAHAKEEDIKRHYKYNYNDENYLAEVNDYEERVKNYKANGSCFLSFPRPPSRPPRSNTEEGAKLEYAFNMLLEFKKFTALNSLN